MFIKYFSLRTACRVPESKDQICDNSVFIMANRFDEVDLFKVLYSLNVGGYKRILAALHPCETIILALALHLCDRLGLKDIASVNQSA